MFFQKSILHLQEENLGLFDFESILRLLEWFLALTFDFLPLEVRFRFLKVKVNILSLRVEFSLSGLSLGIW